MMPRAGNGGDYRHIERRSIIFTEAIFLDGDRGAIYFDFFFSALYFQQLLHHELKLMSTIRYQLLERINMVDPVTLTAAVRIGEITSLSIHSFGTFKKIFNVRANYRVNYFLNNCYRLYLHGTKESQKAKKAFIKIVDEDSEKFADRMADFINQTIYCSSDLCSICYSFLYNRHICQGKDIFGVSGQTFEELATTMIQGMRDRDIRFYVALYDYVENNPKLKVPDEQLKVCCMNGPEISDFLTKNPDLKITHEVFIALHYDFLRRGILIYSNIVFMDGPPVVAFVLGEYSKDFYALFKEANDFLICQ